MQIPSPQPVLRSHPILQALTLCVAFTVVACLAVRDLMTEMGSEVDVPIVEDSPLRSSAVEVDRPVTESVSEWLASPVSPFVFDPNLPHGPKRWWERPSRYTAPPPGGTHQYEAVTAARRRDCAGAMVAVERGMEVSIDHAALYRGVWMCFNEAHQRRLEQSRAADWAELVPLLEHFEGPSGVLEQASATHELPRWYLEAVDGIEYRLDRFQSDERLRDIVDDLFQPAVIADHLAKDIHMEALVAFGLSRVPPSQRTPELIDAWARRVFYTAWTLDGKPGTYLVKHRRSLVQELRYLLDAATSSPAEVAWEVPAVVVEARAVGEPGWLQP